MILLVEGTGFCWPLSVSSCVRQLDNPKYLASTSPSSTDFLNHLAGASAVQAD